MHLFSLNNATARKALSGSVVGVVAATLATGALAAGHSEHGAGRIHRGGGGAVFVPAPQTPVFNPSVPYTVPQAPETPVSPASPGSVFGN